MNPFLPWGLCRRSSWWTVLHGPELPLTSPRGMPRLCLLVELPLTIVDTHPSLYHLAVLASKTDGQQGNSLGLVSDRAALHGRTGLRSQA